NLQNAWAPAVSQLGNIAAGALTGGGASGSIGATDLQQDCGLTDFTARNSCQDFSKGDGTFDQKKFDAYIATLTKAEQNAECKETKLASIKKEMECFRNAASTLHNV